MNLFKKIILLCCFSLSINAFAQAPAKTAVETAEEGVERLLEKVSASKQYFLSDRARYFAEIQSVLDDVVDFEAVAEVVMSRYAESATEQQKERFAKILETTLTSFYGASLASYNGEELVFLPSDAAPSDPGADTIVSMELRADSPIRLQYQMFVNEDNEWKLKNLSLMGINLGRQYYTQFAASMEEYNNDIDKVLDNW